MTRIKSQSRPLTEVAFKKANVEAKIVETLNQDDLKLISMPDIQAVIYRSSSSPWLEELAKVIEAGKFRIPRTVLTNVTIDDIATWLDNEPSANKEFPELYSLLKYEILSLVEWECSLTGSSHLMLRIFTEAPTLRCGFHVDTAAPRAPTVGLLRVFNGSGTKYIDPSNITNMRDFYDYVSQRERLGKLLEDALNRDDTAAVEVFSTQIKSLEIKPGFLHNPEDIREVESKAIIAFKHVDTRLHWSNHPKNMAWVHCSPEMGGVRLVVNITAHER